MITLLAGLTFDISANVPVSQTYSAYEALTYSNIGYMSEFGEHGTEYEVTTFNPITTRGTLKFKTSLDYGNKSIDLAYDPTDGGILLLKEALNTQLEYAFRLVYKDNVTEYFTAKVTSIIRSSGSIKSMRMLSVMLNITEFIDQDVEVRYLVSDTSRLLADTGTYLITTG